MAQPTVDRLKPLMEALAEESRKVIDSVARDEVEKLKGYYREIGVPGGSIRCNITLTVEAVEEPRLP